jgi:hypothetical protein
MRIASDFIGAAGVRMAVKTILQGVLPGAVYNEGAAIWRRVRNQVEYTRALGIKTRLATFGTQLPTKFLLFGRSPGDDLLCTAVLRELKRRGAGDVFMISNYPELFTGTGDAASIIPFDRYERFARVFQEKVQRLVYAPSDGDDRSRPPRRHIIAQLCANVGITDWVPLKPYLSLSESEKAFGAWARGHIVVQSSGLSARLPMLNKQWYPGRFQEVVDRLCDEFGFVQIGSALEPALRRVKDLRGATGIRESAAILHHARLYVGTVGFLMHLARAVDCPSVIVYGGREAPWQSGYICNTNLYTALPCAPCWRWNTCDIDRKCMSDILVDNVVAAIHEMMSKPRNPLAVEIVSG